MSHCVDFYKKWKKEPNFCGIGAQGIKRVEIYLDLIREIVDSGLDEEICYKNISSNAINYTWFVKLRKDSPIRKKVIENIIATIADEKRIRRKDIREWVGIENWTVKTAESNLNLKEYNEFCEDIQCKQELLKKVKLEKYRDNEVYRNGKGKLIIAKTLGQRTNLLQSLLSSGQKSILTEMVNFGFGDNEYAAMCILFKWGVEKLESERKFKNPASEAVLP